MSEFRGPHRIAVFRQLRLDRGWGDTAAAEAGHGRRIRLQRMNAHTRGATKTLKHPQESMLGQINDNKSGETIRAGDF
jgi:hypothetical protein